MHHAGLLNIYHLKLSCMPIHRPFENAFAEVSSVPLVEQHSPHVAQQAQRLHATFLPPGAYSIRMCAADAGASKQVEILGLLEVAEDLQRQCHI